MVVLRDTLVRHSSIHHHGHQAHSTPRRCAHACLSCARLKQRCRGGLPCARCQQTGTECTYSKAKQTPVTTGSVSPDQHPSHANTQTTALHVTNSQLPEAAEQSALHHTTTNSQGHLSFSPTAATHPIPVPAAFTPSSLHSDPTLYASDQWSSSLSLHGDTVVNEFAAGWDAMTAYFPFCLVPEGLDHVLDTPHDMENHNHQCGIEMHSHSSGYPLQGQAARAPSIECLNQTVSDHSPDLHPASPAANSFGLHGKPPCRQFPQTQDNHMQTAEAEIFGHVHDISPRAYQDLQNFYATQCWDSTWSFVPVRLLQAFVDLYFEYFDPQFPFLHVSHLNAEEVPWMLLLATAAIGSYYSELDDIHDYTSILCDLLGRAVDSEVPCHLNPTFF